MSRDAWTLSLSSSQFLWTTFNSSGSDHAHCDKVLLIIKYSFDFLLSRLCYQSLNPNGKVQISRRRCLGSSKHLFSSAPGFMILFLQLLPLNTIGQFLLSGNSFLGHQTNFLYPSTGKIRLIAGPNFIHFTKTFADMRSLVLSPLIIFRH